MATQSVRKTTPELKSWVVYRSPLRRLWPVALLLLAALALVLVSNWSLVVEKPLVVEVENVPQVQEPLSAAPPAKPVQIVPFNEVILPHFDVETHLLNFDNTLEVVPALMDVPENVVVAGTSDLEKYQAMLKSAFLAGDEASILQAGQWFVINAKTDPVVEQYRLTEAENFEIAARRGWNGLNVDWVANSVVTIHALGFTEKAQKLYNDAREAIKLEVGRATEEELLTSSAPPASTDPTLDQQFGVIPETPPLEDPLWNYEIPPVVVEQRGVFGVGIALDPILWNLRDLFNFLKGNPLENRSMTALKVVEIAPGTLAVIMGEDPSMSLPADLDPVGLIKSNRWNGYTQDGKRWWVGISLLGNIREGDTVPVGTVVRFLAAITGYLKN